LKDKKVTRADVFSQNTIKVYFDSSKKKKLLYSEVMVEQIFNSYGMVAKVLLRGESPRYKSALVEFKHRDSALKVI